MVVKKKWRLKEEWNGILRVGLQPQKICVVIVLSSQTSQIMATKKSWLIKALSALLQKIVILLEK
jgi:hypothetical protein